MEQPSLFLRFHMNFTLFGFNFNFLQKSERTNYNVSSNAVNELGKKRALIVCERARDLARKMNLTGLAVLRREHDPLNANFAEAMYVEHWDKRICYNYFFLIEPEDFPEEFRLTNENDPRLYNNKYLNQFSELIKNKLGMEKLTINEIDRSVLRIILKLLSNPEKCKLAKEFLLAHEISHLFYQHRISFNADSQKWRLAKRVTSIAIGILSGVMVMKITISYLLGTACGISIFGITLFALNILQECSISRKQEKEADLKASELVGPEGGIYFFETMRKNIISFSKNPDLSLIKRMLIQIGFNGKGDFRFNQFVTHPNPRERVEYLQKIIK